MAKRNTLTSNKLLEIKRFWKWFAANHQDFYDAFETPDIPIVYHMSKRLRRISAYLGYLLTYRSSTDTVICNFCTNGSRRHVQLTQAMIDACPGFEGWEFVPFLPPMQDLSSYRDRTEEGYQFGESIIYIHEMKYKIEQYDVNRRIMSITIYLPTYRLHYDDPRFEDQIRSDVQLITGEYLFHRNLRIVGYAQLKEKHKNLPNVYEIAEKLEELREIKKRARMAVRQLIQS